MEGSGVALISPVPNDVYRWVMAADEEGMLSGIAAGKLLMFSNELFTHAHVNNLSPIKLCDTEKEKNSKVRMI